MQLPPLIYGTAWKKDLTQELVIQAVQAGFRAIDTACQPKHYNEEGVGDGLEVLYEQGFKREELFLQTKFTPISGQDPLNVPYDKKAALSTQVEQSFEVSKRNLQTDYVDSLVLHSPLFPFKDLMSVWQAMEKIYQEDGAKRLGISNTYDLEVLKRLYEEAEVKPSILQNRFYQDSNYDKAIRLWCKEHHIIYQSFWTLTANPHILESKELFTLARKYNKNVIQLFFAYLHQIGITPLTGTKDTKHMQLDLQSFDITLEDNEVSKLDSLFK